MVLDPRVVMVIGGGSEIGREICSAFVERGASLVVGDANPAAAEAVATRRRADGADVIGLGVDPTDPTSNERLVTRARERFGRADVLVNCLDFARAQHEDLDRTRAALAMGVYLAAQAVVPAMRGQRGGCIVNVVSRGTEWPHPRRLGVPSGPGDGEGSKTEWWYGGSPSAKGGPARAGVDEREWAPARRRDDLRRNARLEEDVARLTWWLARSVAGDGVRVNCVTYGESVRGVLGLSSRGVSAEFEGEDGGPDGAYVAPECRSPDGFRRGSSAGRTWPRDRGDESLLRLCEPLLRQHHRLELLSSVTTAVLYLASNEARHSTGKVLHVDAADCPMEVAA